MKADELEDLKVYSKVLNDGFVKISVLSSLLERQICNTMRCVDNFKSYVDEKLSQNTRQNH